MQSLVFCCTLHGGSSRPLSPRRCMIVLGWKASHFSRKCTDVRIITEVQRVYWGEGTDPKWHSVDLVVADVKSTYWRSHSTQGHGLKAVMKEILHSQTRRPYSRTSGISDNLLCERLSLLRLGSSNKQRGIWVSLLCCRWGGEWWRIGLTHYGFALPHFF